MNLICNEQHGCKYYTRNDKLSDYQSSQNSNWNARIITTHVITELTSYAGRGKTCSVIWIDTPTLTGVRGSAAGWGSAMGSLTFFIHLSFRPYHGPGVDSHFNRNEYQVSSVRVKATGA